MEKIVRKITSLILTLALCVNLLPLNAIAEEASSPAVPAQTAVSELMEKEPSTAESAAEPTEEAATPPQGNSSDETQNQENRVTDGVVEDTVIDESNDDVTEALNRFSQVPMPMAAGDDVQRYTVLILDTSGSMSGAPATAQKAAAIKFCESVMKADGTNYVAVVRLNTSSTVGQAFTSDIEVLRSYINKIPSSGGTNTNQALEKAESLLDGIPDDGSGNIIKNIVLCSDGLPESGDTSTSGKYTSQDHGYDYRYANVVYDTATKIKNKSYTIYSLGFFHKLSGQDLAFGQLLMSDIATKGQYYEVTDPDDLEFVFGTIGSEITAQPYPFAFTGFLDPSKDFEGTCYYTDGYFTHDASIYDNHLATMSLCFELTTWSRADGIWTDNPADATGEEKTRWQNAYNLLVGQLGYQNFDANVFWNAEPTRDSIGVVAATKTNTYDNSTIIAVGVRGGGYYQEWASNFTLGKTGDHQGFAEARDNVLDFLKSYVAENGIQGNVKIWLVGYSRGGAVANMVAGKMNDDPNCLGNNVTISPENLFAYTFEAPQGAMQSEVVQNTYSNIHNTVNLNDIVPLVAPSAWEFARYNVDRYLPTAATSDQYASKLSSMLQYYDSLFSSTEKYDGYHIEEYAKMYKPTFHWEAILPKGDPFFTIDEVPLDIPISIALTESVAFLANGAIGDRENYYYNLEDMVRTIMSVVYGGSLGDMVESNDITMEEFLTKFFGELTIDKILDIASPMVALNFDSIDERKAKVYEKIQRYVMDILGDSDLWGTAMNFVSLGDTLSDMLFNIFDYALDDLVEKDGTALISVVNVVTLVANGGLFQAHYPEITLAWLMSEDSFYLEGQTDFVCANYRVVHINCPVDIKVYRAATNELVAAIVNDVPQQIEGSYIYAYINENGEKMVLLPSDGEYRIEITATDTGTMSYTLNEYDLATNTSTKIQNYSNIQITKGEVLTAYVPVLPEDERENPQPNGSSVVYTLFQANTELEPTRSLSGVNAQNAVYNVAVRTDSDQGMVVGSGEYMVGTFAQVEAYAMTDGVTFAGWYQGDTLVSQDATYRFEVTADTELEARFTDLKTYSLKVVSEGNGHVLNQDVAVPAGMKVELEAVPGTGASFVAWTLDKADEGEIQDTQNRSTWMTMPACDLVVTAKFTGDTPAEDGEEDLNNEETGDDTIIENNGGNNNDAASTGDSKSGATVDPEERKAKVSSTDTSDSIPQTGDSLPVRGLEVLFLASAASILLILAVKKKKDPFSQK